MRRSISSIQEREKSCCVEGQKQLVLRLRALGETREEAFVRCGTRIAARATTWSTASRRTEREMIHGVRFSTAWPGTTSRGAVACRP